MLSSLRPLRRLSSLRPLHRASAYPSLFPRPFAPKSLPILQTNLSFSLFSSLSADNGEEKSTSSITTSTSSPLSPISEDDGEQPIISYRHTEAYAAIDLALDSVVKIFTVSSSPNYSLPWQNKSQRESMGSGFVLPGQRIVTNAHVVADHTFVLVRKHGSPTKYRAEVQAIGHECDLALLTVENEEFWEGMNFLELGDIPFLQEAVAVVGYPQVSFWDLRWMVKTLGDSMTMEEIHKAYA